MTTNGCKYVYRLVRVLDEIVRGKVSTDNEKLLSKIPSQPIKELQADFAEEDENMRVEMIPLVHEQKAASTQKVDESIEVDIETLEEEKVVNTHTSPKAEKHSPVLETSKVSTSTESKMEIEAKDEEQSSCDNILIENAKVAADNIVFKRSARRSRRIAESSLPKDEFPNHATPTILTNGIIENATPMHNPFVEILHQQPGCEDDSVNHDLSQNSFLNFSFQEASANNNGPLCSAMNPTLANSCWRALNSSDIHNGFGALAHLESTWNVFPSDNLAESLSKFLVHGPEKDGSNIRQPYRTEMTFQYMNKVMTKSELDSQKQKIGLQQLDGLESFLAMPMNETKQFDRVKSSLSQTHRLSKALQFCSNSLNFVATAMTMEMKSIISGAVQPTAKSLGEMTLASLFLMQDIRESLKMVVRYAMKFLLRHGYFLVGFPGEQNWSCESSQQQMCAKESQLCINAYGTIVVHAAWLFCASENISFGDESCCFLIYDIIDAELAELDYMSLTTKKKLSAKNREKYKKDIKIRFLSSLTTDFSSKLQLELASHFNLSSEAKLLFS